MQVSFSFKPSGQPWSTNADRTLNQFKRAELIKTWKTDAKIHYTNHMNRMELRRELRPASIQITIPFGRKPIGDPHNYCGTVLKAIIDGLVAAGAWPDDTPEYVGHTEPILIKGELCVVEINER